MSTLMPHLLTLLIVSPLLGAALAMLLPAKLAKPVGLLASLVPVALLVPVFQHFNPAQPGLQFTESYLWLPILNITYSVGIDGIALVLIALTVMLTPLCLLASWDEQRNPGAFFATLLAIESATIGVFCAADFILFYLFFEAMLIPMFLLIGLWGGQQRIYASLKFFLYTLLGSVLMLVAGLWLHAHTGSFSFAAWQNLNLPLATQQLLFLAFLAAFAVKIPMWPVHTWLPDAHVQAPTAGSVILAGILLKLGAYGLLRFNLPMFPEASIFFAPAIFVLSAIAVVYAAWVAWVQTDVKKLIAYSSVSHMGLVTLALFAIAKGGNDTALHGALLVMLNHGIVSAGLFLAIGVIYNRLHTRDITHFGALASLMPAYAFVTMVLTLAAVALPGTNSFVGEFLSLAGSYPASPWATAAATTGVIFGAVYMLHFYRALFFGTASSVVAEHRAQLTDLSPREWLTFLPLLALIPILGLAPNLVMNLWQAPVNSLVQQYQIACRNAQDAKNPNPAPVSGTLVPSLPGSAPVSPSVALSSNPA